MFTLYSRPNSGSAAVEALLAELGVDFKILDMLRNKDGSTPEELLAVNPLGKIPVLRLPDNSLMTESAAMMVYLADLFPNSGLAPAADSYLRAPYLAWMLYFASSVYMADLRYYYPQRHSTDPLHAPLVKVRAAEDLEMAFQHFAKHMGPGPFILGDIFSAVDIYAAMLISWAPDVTALFEQQSKLKVLYMRVANRPKIANVWARNEMPL